jgi:hypothetical protein
MVTKMVSGGKRYLGKTGKLLESHSRTFSVLYIRKPKFKILTFSKDLFDL